jgi:photosystem II stability/assembly factor-like uncharacterized protein
VVTASFERTGTFFIVARTGRGKARVVWNIKDVAKRHYAKHDQLGYWVYVGRGVGDGPLSGTVHLLPPTKRGRQRFFVDATSNPIMGTTHAKQISIWEWNGHTPLLRLMQCYSVSEAPPPTFEGDLLTIHTKECLRTILTSGADPEPEAIWRIRISPEGIEDLGRQLVTPEIQVLDELFFRLKGHQQVGDIARVQVIDDLKFLLPELHTKDDDLGSAGWRVTRAGNHAVVQLGFDSPNVASLFAVDRREDGFVTTGVRVDREHYGDFWAPHCSRDAARVTGGSTGATVRAVAFAAGNPRIVYAGDDNLVVRSDDGGRHWVNMQCPSAGDVRALAVHPSDAAVVYAATSRGVMQSTDGGATWTETLTTRSESRQGQIYQVPIDAHVVAIDSHLPETVYVGGRAAWWFDRLNLFKSTDAGKTWQGSSSGLDAQTVYTLAIDPRATERLYAGTDRGVFATIDAGRTWRWVSAGAIDELVTALAIDLEMTETVYAGTFGEGVFVSTDGGSSWQARNAGLGDLHVQALAVGRGTPAAVYAATQPGLYRSLDAGRSWVRADEVGHVTALSLAVDPANARDVLAGTVGSGVIERLLAATP